MGETQKKISAAENRREWSLTRIRRVEILYAVSERPEDPNTRYRPKRQCPQ
jgi:hypothetical protein